MQLHKAEIRCKWECDKKRKRKQMLCVVFFTVIVFMVCIGFRYHNLFQYKRIEVFAPFEHYHILWLRLRIFFSSLLNTPFHQQQEELKATFGIIEWGGCYTRLEVTLMAFFAGAGLAVAGAIFQTIYKNPMASPNILGSTAGVQLGNIIMVAFYSAAALDLVALRYKYCYGLTAVCVVVVIILGKLSGDRKGNPSVMQMVMAGSVISQGLHAIVIYYMYQLTEEDLELYQGISMGTYINTEWKSWMIFAIAMAAGMLPMLLLRYRMNVTGIDDAEARASGVNPAPYRFVGQICGVVMVTAAMIHCGEAGMLTMVIPYIARAAVGADFRRVFAYSALFGGCLMMICRTVSTVVILRDADGGMLVDFTGNPVVLPVTFIVNICLTPIFIIILAKQRRIFE